jgi:hypothetical protein
LDPVIESSISMEPDTIFSQLPKLIECWDPPSSMPTRPFRRIQEAITVSMLNGEVSAVSLDDSIQSDLDSHANMIVLGKAGYHSIHRLISNYITGTYRRARLDASFNTRYGVKNYVFANFIALCRAINFTNPII